MPVILKRDDYQTWLDPGLKDVALVSQLLRPFDAHPMRSFAVSNRVNRVENDDIECSAAVDEGRTTQTQLFL
jgi:putative SOS response-associated peptidase YedK